MAEYLLKHPIKRTLRVQGGGATEETVDAVEIRRVNGGDIRWLEQNRGKPGASLTLLQRLTGLDTSQVDLLDAEDIAEITDIVTGFLPASLTTGQGSSAT